MPQRQRPSVWLRLPRLVYWVAGAAVSFAAAAAAGLVADMAPPAYRVPIWLTGALFVFVGLGILSLGTKGRIEVEQLFEENGDQPEADGDGPPAPPGAS